MTMLSSLLLLLLFCLMMILTIGEKDKLSAQVGNDGSVRNIRSLLSDDGSDGSKPNGGVWNLDTAPQPGTCVSFDHDGVTIKGKVLASGTHDDSISVQAFEETDTIECEINHLPTATIRRYPVHTAMLGCAYNELGDQIETDNKPACVFSSADATHIPISDPGIAKTTCNCSEQYYGRNTIWGSTYPIVAGTSMTQSYESNDEKHQIDAAKVIKDEITLEAADTKFIIASFCTNTTYLHTQFPSTTANTDASLTVMVPSTNVNSLFAFAQKAVAKGMHYTQNGHNTVTMILCAEKLVEGLYGTHNVEFANLLDTSGCYGTNNHKHTVIFTYYEEDNEISGDGHNAFPLVAHVRFASPLHAAAGSAVASIFGSSAAQFVRPSLSRAALPSYGMSACNGVCNTGQTIAAIVASAGALNARLSTLGYGMLQFCGAGGTTHDATITAACNNRALTQPNTCEGDNICEKLVKSSCGVASLTADALIGANGAAQVVAIARNQGLLTVAACG